MGVRKDARSRGIENGNGQELLQKRNSVCLTCFIITEYLKGDGQPNRECIFRFFDYWAKDCDLYSVIDNRTPLKELEQRRHQVLQGISKEWYLEAFLGIGFFFSHLKVREIVFTAQRWF